MGAVFLHFDIKWESRGIVSLWWEFEGNALMINPSEIP